MLLSMDRCLLRAGCCLFRRFTTASESSFPPEYNNNHYDDHYMEKSQDFKNLRSENLKSLKIAIIGLPNVGKSTLINRLINRHVCATASRMHVTRQKADAVYCENDTQLVFIDTPGLVSPHELKKFALEQSFREDAKMAMESADIVGVVQDVSNKHTRGIIHNRILELVKMTRVGVPSILIMNKIDQMRKKQQLLPLVTSLTSEEGWPNFSDVFMVSALTADGINDLKNYFLDSAKYRDWDYDRDVVTNQPLDRLIERIIRSKFMDSLPHEIPYQIKYEIEHLDTGKDDTVHCVLVATCKCERIAKMALGKKGERVKAIALAAEQECSNALRTSVRIKIAVRVAEEK